LIDQFQLWKIDFSNNQSKKLFTLINHTQLKELLTSQLKELSKSTEMSQLKKSSIDQCQLNKSDTLTNQSIKTKSSIKIKKSQFIKKESPKKSSTDQFHSSKKKLLKKLLTDHTQSTKTNWSMPQQEVLKWENLLEIPNNQSWDNQNSIQPLPVFPKEVPELLEKTWWFLNQDSPNKENGTLKDKDNLPHNKPLQDSKDSNKEDSNNKDSNNKDSNNKDSNNKDSHNKDSHNKEDYNNLDMDNNKANNPQLKQKRNQPQEVDMLSIDHNLMMMMSSMMISERKDFV